MINNLGGLAFCQKLLKGDFVMKHSKKYAKHRKKWRLIDYYQPLKENALVKVIRLAVQIVNFLVTIRIVIAILYFTLQVSEKIILWIIPYLKIIYHFLSQVTSLFCCLQRSDVI